MIDTIKLMLDKTMLAMIDKDRFERGLGNSSRGYYTLVQNPTSSELKQGIYKPRLTLTNRFISYRRSAETLAVEFSAPKLINKNNFDELTEDDFAPVISRLQEALKDMGVMVFKPLLTQALVSSVHYSKNIPLTDHTIPQTYLKELNKLNINKKLDTNQTDYRNEGQSFKYRANSFEVVFYDKLADLEQAKISPKRSEEKKDVLIQLNLFDKYKPKEPFQVLRMEVRLNTRRKIRSMINKLNLDKEPTLRDLFDLKVSLKILNHYLDEIEDAYPPLLLLEEDKTIDLFSTLLQTATPATALKLTGLHQILKESGVRELRDIIDPISKNYWYLLNKEARRHAKHDRKSIFNLLRPHITNYTPLRLVDYQDQLLNNDKYD